MAYFDKAPNGARRTRRSVTKAAGIALAALVALSARAKSASAQDNQHGEGGGGDSGVPCFLRGTKILTSKGHRNVEDLRVGDFLPTVFGGMSPIEWIGCYGFKKSDSDNPWPDEAKPVRIMRSALDDNVPDAELYLTASHALFIDGVLVPVGNLINGTTITLDDADEFDRLEYFHIKLETHDVIEAQGALCESLLEIRETDAMFGDYIRKYGAAKTKETPCAPILSFNGGRNEIKSRLRSAVSVWLDRRQQLDVIRDRLEERGIALGQNTTLPESFAKSRRVQISVRISP